MAPRIGSEYIGIVGPQVGYDLMLDIALAQCQAIQRCPGTLSRRNRNVGRDPLRDDHQRVVRRWHGGSGGGSGNHPGAKPIYLSIFTGKDGYGTVALSGQSPYRPQIMICDTPDKSDPANQLTTATWKAFYQSAVLNAGSGSRSVRSRGTYA